MKPASPRQYSLVAIILHWTIAAALIFQIALGLGLEELGPNGFAMTQLHKSLGISILFFSLLRLAWRWLRPPPPGPEAGLAGLAAKAVHIGLYIFMIAGPLTGWVLVSAAKLRVPTLIFGTIPWPHLPMPMSFEAPAHSLHGLVSWIGLALILLHIAGALRHLVLLRDGSMLAMAPRRSLFWLLVLSAVPPLAWFLADSMVGRSARHGPSQSPPTPIPPEVSANESQALNDAVAVVPDKPMDAQVQDAKQEPPQWTIKPGGTLSFAVASDAGAITGTFKRWSGRIHFDPEAPEIANVAIIINLASASIDDPTQQAMLIDSDFLDVQNHPEARFTFQSAQALGNDRYTAKGTLDLKGQRGPVGVTFSLSGSGSTRRVDGEATIDRNRFNIGQGSAAEALSPSVQVRFSFQATR